MQTEQAPAPKGQVCFYCGLPLSPDEGVRQIGRDATGREVVIRFHQDARRQCWQRFVVEAVNRAHEEAMGVPVDPYDSPSKHPCAQCGQPSLAWARNNPGGWLCARHFDERFGRLREPSQPRQREEVPRM